MDAITFVVAITALYLVLYFFDCFFKSCMHYPYDAFLRNTGLNVKFFRLHWHTTAFNRTIVRWGSSCSRVFTHGFNLGTIISLGLMVFGVLLLCSTLFSLSNSNETGKQSTTSDKYGMEMQILLPGVNLPLNEIGYYMTALLVSSVVHEMGHAIAAVMEDVPVTGFGIYVTFCFPVAYTELSSEHLNGLKTVRRLRILCAGIWHNVVLAAILFVAFSALGPILMPFYQTNAAVVVTHLTRDSYLRGEKGLYRFDTLNSINDCKTNDLDTWHSCLTRTLRVKPAFCVSSDFIRLNDETGLTSHVDDGLVQCCDPKNSKVMCFEYMNDLSNDDPIEIPQHMCLDIRKMVEDSSGFCTATCDEGFCIKPLLNNATTIFVISRRNKEKVVYVGHPTDLYRTIKVSGFVPKGSIFAPELADAISLFLKYNIVFSLGLAVANAIPCFGLDGYHITNTIINSVLVNRIGGERAKRELILLTVSCLGTIMFVGSITKILWNSLFAKLF